MANIASPSITPSSSVRPSFDLPNTARSSSPAPTALGSNPQRRNRTALRDYYNLNNSKAASIPQQNSSNQTGPASNASRTSSISTEAAGAAATAQHGPSEPSFSTSSTQLDEPDFDADAYIRSLLQTSDLKTILRAEAALVSEIRNLDGERKALVYDNYSKLIAATQTIGNMRRSMDDEAAAASAGIRGSRIGEGSSGGKGLRSMNALAPAVEAVARTAQELDTKARRRGGEVNGTGAETGTGNADASGRSQQARNIRNHAKAAADEKKQTVRWVLGAPERLGIKLGEGKTEDAQRDWDVVKKFLDRWEGVRGTAEVRKACEEAMAKQAEEKEEPAG